MYTGFQKKLDSILRFVLNYLLSSQNNNWTSRNEITIIFAKLLHLQEKQAQLKSHESIKSANWCGISSRDKFKGFN